MRKIPNVRVTVTTKKLMSVVLSEEDVSAVLREYFKFPPNANVEYDCRHDFLNNVAISHEELVTDAEPEAVQGPSPQSS